MFAKDSIIIAFSPFLQRKMVIAERQKWASVRIPVQETIYNITNLLPNKLLGLHDCSSVD